MPRDRRTEMDTRAAEANIFLFVCFFSLREGGSAFFFYEATKSAIHIIQ